MKRLIAAAGISMGIFGIAAGVNAAELTPISLYSGHGTTLNFRAVNEKVQRVWLDDPSQVTVDFDDVNCRTQEQTCAAQVIHLRQIKRLKFDDLPTTSSTSLTVVTDKSIHQFQLSFPVSGKPKSTIVNIAPDPEAKSQSSRRESR
jgi:S-adenosylmethionine synthetase